MNANLIIENAKIYTADEDFSVFDSLAVKDGKIIAIGNSLNSEIRNLNSQNKKNDQNPLIIDAKGKPIYPGFYDGHCHFLGYAKTLRNANLKNTKSLEEIITILQEYKQNNPEADWILGLGWDQNNWQHKELPTNELLNKAFPDTPVYLKRIDGHAALVNHKAIEIAEINNETKISGGALLKNTKGLTGVLVDNAMRLVSSHIPELAYNKRKELTSQAQDNCFAVGLTSVQDAGLYPQDFELLNDMSSSNNLKIGINAVPFATEQNLGMINNGTYWRKNIHFTAIKMLADGALGSRGAYLLEPYTDSPNEQGFLLKPESYFNKWCEVARENNLQTYIHAIGDGANRFALNTYKKFLYPDNDLRWRIEHAQIVSEKDIDTYGKYNIIPSVQTTHCTSDMFWAKTRLGEKRLKRSYIFQELLQQNGWIVNGSDFPIEDINPLYGFYAGVARKNRDGNPEQGFQTKNRLTREQALRSMTIWAAKGCFEENVKGSLEVGKNADFVMLDRDVMECDESKILDAKVLSTYVNGECVYECRD